MSVEIILGYFALIPNPSPGGRRAFLKVQKAVLKSLACENEMNHPVTVW